MKRDDEKAHARYVQKLTGLSYNAALLQVRKADAKQAEVRALMDAYDLTFPEALARWVKGVKPKGRRGRTRRR